jgi:hypothetical protein
MESGARSPDAGAALSDGRVFFGTAFRLMRPCRFTGKQERDMPDLRYLEERAFQCRKLAREMQGGRAAQDLLELARTYERQVGSYRHEDRAGAVPVRH